MRIPAIATLLLLLCGCGHARQPDAAAAPSPAERFNLPAPSTLSHRVSGPPTDYQRQQTGSFYLKSWPYRNVNDIIVGKGIFTPQWDPAEPSMDKAAYAIYPLYQMAGYSGKKRVHLEYDPPKPPFGDLYVGLANIARDRWDWFRVNGNYDAFFYSDYSDYVDPQEYMFVCVMQLGKTTSTMSQVVVGDTYILNPTIVTDLNQDLSQNLAPLTVKFDGYGYPSGSFVTSYDWDWDSDGIYDTMHQQHTSHLFDMGTYTVTMRVTTADGATATKTQAVTAVDPANLPPEAHFTTNDNTNGPAPLHIHFDASTSSDPDGTIIRYDWDFDGDSVVDFSSPDPTADFDFGEKGPVSVKLTVVDNDYGTASISMGINITQGWTTVLIDGSAQLQWTYLGGRQIDIGDFGTSTPRAGIVYRDEATDTLCFARSTDATGSSWFAPVSFLTETGTGYSPRIAKTVSGAPMVAYGKFDSASSTFSQQVVTATNDTAASWNSPATVNGGASMGFDSDLIVINTLPALAAHTGNYLAQENSIVYILGKDPTGSAWNDPVTVLGPGESYQNVALSTCGGGLFKHPAIGLCMRADLTDYKMAYTYSTDVDGTAWSLINKFPVDAIYPSLSSIDGNPAWVTGQPTYLWPDSGLRYCRADDANGSAWPATTQLIAPGGEAELVTWNGKPAIVFVDRDTVSAVQIATAKDADGTDWNTPYIVDKGVGILAAHAAIVGGNLIIVYYNSQSDFLAGCYWN